MKKPTDNTIDTNAYAEGALLTTLRRSVWTAKIKATDLDRKIATENDAEGKATKTDKFLVTTDEPKWKAVKSANTAVHDVWKKWASPWWDGGTRMVSSWTFMEFASRVEEKIEKFNEAVEAFCADYENIVRRQAPRLGKLFNASDYPSQSDIRRKFGITVDYMPVPTEGDFRCQLADDQMEKVRESTRKAVEAAMARAARDPWERLQKVVQTVVATLSTPDKIFRDTLVNNIRDLCDTIPSLNIGCDPKLDEITDRIKKELVTLNPKAMRDPKWKQTGEAGYDRSCAAQAERKAAKEAAQDILTRMNELMI